MDSKSDIDGAEKQDNLSVSVDEPEKVQQVEAESDIGTDKTVLFMTGLLKVKFHVKALDT